jgi:hypothetical protein
MFTDIEWNMLPKQRMMLDRLNLLISKNLILKYELVGCLYMKIRNFNGHDIQVTDTEVSSFYVVHANTRVDII